MGSRRCPPRAQTAQCDLTAVPANPLERSGGSSRIAPRRALQCFRRPPGFWRGHGVRSPSPRQWAPRACGDLQATTLLYIGPDRIDVDVVFRSGKGGKVKELAEYDGVEAEFAIERPLRPNMLPYSAS